VNGHPISHLSRDRFVLDVLFKEGAKKASVAVLDYFGSGRNKKFENDQVKFHNWQPYSVRGDASRSLTERVSEVPQCDFAIIQDVYFGRCGALTPQDVQEIAAKTITGRVYICARVFLGQCGGDDCAEGIWMRGEHGILFSPERNMPTYNSHPDINWILDRSCEEIDVAPLDLCGPYQITRCTLAVPGAVSLLPANYPPGRVVSRTLVYSSLWSLFRRSEERWVHMPTLCIPARKFLTRCTTGVSLDSCVSMVTSSFSSDAVMSEMVHRFPDMYIRVFQDTVQACLYDGRTQSVEQILFLRRWFASDEKALTAARSVAPLVPTWFVLPDRISTLPWLQVLFAILFVFFLYWLESNLDCFDQYGNLQVPTLLVKIWTCFVIFLRQASASFAWSWFGPSWAKHAWWAEEISKIILPKFSGVMCSVEIYRKKGSNRVVSLAFHSFTFWCYFVFGWWALPFCVAFHWLWNCSSYKQDLWERFVERYELGVRDAECSQLINLPLGTNLPPFTTATTSKPKDFRGSLKIRIGGEDTAIEEALERLPVGGRNLTWPLMATNGMLWQPANNARNLLAAAVWRTHNDPFVGFPDNEERHGNWEKLKVVFSLLLDSEVRTLLTVDDCARLMGKRGNRILAAYERVKEGSLKSFSKTITLKWNETLPVDKNCNGILTLKPRAIINLDPRLHAMMSPWSRAMTDVMHQIFDGKAVLINGTSVRLFFAAGYDHGQLCDLAGYFGGDDVVIAASGDDSVVSWGGYLKGAMIPYAEADQSKFDHTQDQGPLSLSQFWMGKLGAPSWFLEMVRFCCSAPYTSRKHDMTTLGEAGTQMPTGITVTTLLNSMATLAMYMYVIDNKSKDVVASARELGFDVKLHEYYEVNHVTFLKGWWQYSDNELVWLPLPSAVVKLGKLIRSPLEIAQVKNWEIAYSRCAFALASSYGLVPFEYPILGPFLRKMLQLGSSDVRVRGLGLLESWKPNIECSINLNLERCYEAFQSRYDFEIGDISRCEKLIESVDRFPCYLEDSVFLKLSVVDY